MSRNYTTQDLAQQVMLRSGCDYADALVYVDSNRADALHMLGLREGGPDGKEREYSCDLRDFCRKLGLAANCSLSEAQAKISAIPVDAGLDVNGLVIRAVTDNPEEVLRRSFKLSTAAARQLAISVGWLVPGTEQTAIAAQPPTPDQVRRAGSGTYAESSAAANEAARRAGHVSAKMGFLEIAQALTPPGANASQEDEAFCQAVGLANRLSGQGGR